MKAVIITKDMASVTQVTEDQMKDAKVAPNLEKVKVTQAEYQQARIDKVLAVERVWAIMQQQNVLVVDRINGKSYLLVYTKPKEKPKEPKPEPAPEPKERAEEGS